MRIEVVTNAQVISDNGKITIRYSLSSCSGFFEVSKKKGSEITKSDPLFWTLDYEIFIAFSEFIIMGRASGVLREMMFPL